MRSDAALWLVLSFSPPRVLFPRRPATRHTLRDLFPSSVVASPQVGTRTFLVSKSTDPPPGHTRQGRERSVCSSSSFFPLSSRSQEEVRRRHHETWMPGHAPSGLRVVVLCPLPPHLGRDRDRERKGNEESHTGTFALPIESVFRRGLFHFLRAGVLPRVRMQAMRTLSTNRFAFFSFHAQRGLFDPSATSLATP